MKILIKHVLLRELRETRRIPREVMHKKLAISEEEYTRLEETDVEVEFKMARKMANIFKHNWAVFLLDRVPDVVGKNVDNRTYENRKTSLSEKTIDAIENSRFILSFAQSILTKNRLKVPSFDEIKNLNPEELALKVRKISEVSLDEQTKFESSSKALSRWIQFIENSGVFVSQYNLDHVDSIRAFSITENSNAIIVLSTKDSTSARIFSLMHEFCHIIRNSAGLCDLHSSDDLDTEVYCNRFAALFLAPDEIVLEYVRKVSEQSIKGNLKYHAERLAAELKISVLATYRRFASVGLIGKAEYSTIHNSYLKDLPIKRRKGGSGGGNYYRSVSSKNGRSYSRGILNAYDAGKITSNEAGSALGISVKNISKYRNFTAPIQ